MKRICALLLAFALCFCLSVTAFADNVLSEPTPIVDDMTESEIEPRAEEVGWKYRVYNGNLEKRLWSFTYGKWLTDWIYVGPDPNL